MRKKGEKAENVKTITIPIPSFSWRTLSIVLGILLFISISLNLTNKLSSTGHVIATSKLSGLVYICPTGRCDETQVKSWASDIGLSVSKYEANWIRGPVGFIFSNNSVSLIDVSSKSKFYKSVCDGINNPEACRISREEEEKAARLACERTPKKDKPNVKFFVMAFCPFGNQAESGLEPVFRLLGDKVDWEPRYVIYSNYGSGYPDFCLDEENKYCSMHGIQELHQDVREMCVWKYYPADTWWDFVMKINENCNSRNADTCWEPIAKEVGIDVEKIKTCQEEEAISLLAEELELNQKYGVRGSPTIFINDQQYSGDRSPESFKQSICCGFTTQPKECSQKLSGGSSGPSGRC